MGASFFVLEREKCFSWEGLEILGGTFGGLRISGDRYKKLYRGAIGEPWGRKMAFPFLLSVGYGVNRRTIAPVPWQKDSVASRIFGWHFWRRHFGNQRGNEKIVVKKPRVYDIIENR